MWTELTTIGGSKSILAGAKKDFAQNREERLSAPTIQQHIKIGTRFISRSDLT